jgi:hypothetical protein
VCCRAAGGVPVAVALLASGADRRIVRDALAVLSALMCGEGEVSAGERLPLLTRAHPQPTEIFTVCSCGTHQQLWHSMSTLIFLNTLGGLSPVASGRPWLAVSCPLASSAAAHGSPGSNAGTCACACTPHLVPSAALADAVAMMLMNDTAGAAASDAADNARAAAAAEFQAAGGLEALAAIVAGGSSVPHAQSAVGKVGSRRLSWPASFWHIQGIRVWRARKQRPTL